MTTILKDNVTKILIINPFGIGDVLFTTPVIKAIKTACPETSISYWCNQRVHGLFKNNPCIDTIFALSRGDIKRISQKSRLEGIKKFLNLLYQIKKERFDLAIDFSLDYRCGLISKLLGIKKRIGFNYKKRGLFLTHRLDIDGYSGKHVVEYYLDLLKFLPLAPKNKNLDLFISEDDKRYAQDTLNDAVISKDDLIIGIAAGAGASWGIDARLKHWPAENFAKLADKITRVLGGKVILLGDASEQTIASQIINSMVIDNGPPAGETNKTNKINNKLINLTGKTDLGQLTAIISGLRLLITNDGGPLHIAAAVGTKTVSIFGPVDERVYGPYPLNPRQNVVIKTDIACRPCYQKFRMPACMKNRECINSISVEQVFEAVKKLLPEKGTAQ
ncbi:MAG: glycosyltransferase family 9 protein [Candidatus Omnitrophota bacterium]